jgi:GDP-mannose 6-dehydrogenase
MAQKISIFGAGYVGSVSGGCLSKLGHKVILVDIDPVKTDLINAGRSPIIEPGLEELLTEGVKKGLITATQSTETAILNSDISFICVGTPCTKQGCLDLTRVYEVVREIAKTIAVKKDFHLITIRSTILPGTVDKCIDIIEKETGKKNGVDFCFCSNPEFLREGTAIKDYFNPPYTLIGSNDDRSFVIMKKVYQDIDAPLYQTEVKIAEIMKYINNSFHALKVTFANEVGLIAKNLGIDSHKLIDIFVKDTKLNISPTYLKPGFAFGGSCLPKDLKALCYYAKTQDIDVTVLRHVMESNKNHIQAGIDMILETNKHNIGIVGLSFKSGTDDLRESPMVLMVETLLGKGLNVQIYDKNVSLAKIFGANKSFLENHIPHISHLIVDSDKFDEMIERSDVIVVGNREAELVDRIEKAAVEKKKTVIDLVRIDPAWVTGENYQGICW